MAFRAPYAALVREAEIASFSTAIDSIKASERLGRWGYLSMASVAESVPEKRDKREAYLMIEMKKGREELGRWRLAGGCEGVRSSLAAS